MVNKWVLEYIKPESLLDGGHSDKTEAVLPQAHQEKAGFFGKDSDAGKMDGSREKGRPTVRWVDSVKQPQA